MEVENERFGIGVAGSNPCSVEIALGNVMGNAGDAYVWKRGRADGERVKIKTGFGYARQFKGCAQLTPENLRAKLHCEVP
jgi:hypothetical protein